MFHPVLAMSIEAGCATANCACNLHGEPCRGCQSVIGECELQVRASDDTFAMCIRCARGAWAGFGDMQLTSCRPDKESGSSSP